MTIAWEPDDQRRIEAGIERYPAESNRCAALARIVYAVAQPRDERTRGIQITPSAAPWLVLRKPLRRQWGSHTLIETQEHRVDALTGAGGCPAAEYLEAHFKFAQALIVRDVDVNTVDPWIEQEENE
ncbi:MAG: hypothetical protein U0359_41625 [Byssovorax sp.]